MNKQAEYIGLDIETTGLDPYEDKIIEIGLVALDKHFNPIEAQQWLTITPELYADNELSMNPEATELHKVSGLTQDLLNHKKSVDETYNQISEMEAFIKKFSAGQKLPLVGSSISFDREFLRNAFVWNRILNLVHYRSIDATSVALAYEAFAPLDVSDAIHESKNRIRNVMLRQMSDWVPRVSHRAVFDVLTSAALIRAVHLHQVLPKGS